MLAFLLRCRATALAVVVVFIAASIAGCGAEKSVDTGGDIVAAPLPTPQLAAAKESAGKTYMVTTIEAGDLGRAQRVIYGSTDGATGAPTRVSGAFFLPSGTPPEGGWPVIAIGHGTTGLAPNCGPSAYPSQLHQVAPVRMLLDAGFAVTLTDYQGLGSAVDGTDASADNPAHPYLEPRSAAYNLIDSVRAMRSLHPGQISTRWAAAGHSQGGQAAWSATELAQTYAPELSLVAASVQAPAVNLRGVGVPANVASVAWVLPSIITGISIFDPAIDRWNFLRGSPRENLPLLISCDPADDQRREQAKSAITADEVKAATDTDAVALQQALENYSLPQRMSKVPLYVVQGSSDTVVPEQGTRVAVQQACRLGSSVEYHVLSGRDHNIGDDMSGFEWLTQVLNRQNAPESGCGGV